MRKSHSLLTIPFLIFSISTAFATVVKNPCRSFRTHDYAFSGDNGTLSSLGGIDLFANNHDPNVTTFPGTISYYGGDFCSNATVTCTNIGNGTANVQVNSLDDLGSMSGILTDTTVGPVIQITSTSLQDHNDNYVNVTGHLLLGTPPN